MMEDNGLFYRKGQCSNFWLFSGSRSSIHNVPSQDPAAQTIKIYSSEIDMIGSHSYFTFQHLPPAKWPFLNPSIIKVAYEFH
ncbi:hypothetical protein [Xenorhabdus mauleonii]|uniref:hypothetical protein n=1 Tax=Xenorhabdus mauleonii TaxID=351675 RepID=UPI000B832C37|nr:hypothetical protein [Xenorhabdus mauleonii]